MTITSVGALNETSYVQAVLDDLQSLLPNVTSLALPFLKNGCLEPDMSKNTSILILDLGDNECALYSCWNHLPPNLQHLYCSSVTDGLLESNSRRPLRPKRELECLGRLTTSKPHIKVAVLAQIVREAAELKLLDVRHRPNMPCSVQVVCDASTAVDLAAIHYRPGILKDATFKVDCHLHHIEHSSDELLVHAFFDNLPRMKNVTHVALHNMENKCRSCTLQFYNVLPSLLQVFSDVKQLSFTKASRMTNKHLQQLVWCQSLVKLVLVECDLITPAGLLDLCLLLPTLCTIIVTACPKVSGSGLDSCRNLMKEYGLSVEVLETLALSSRFDAFDGA